MLSTTISSIDQVFPLSVINESEIILDSNLSSEDVIVILSKVIAYEAEKYKENTNIYTANIIIKDFSTKKLVEIYRYLLSEESVVNSSLILNIINLIKLYNSFDDSFFNHRLIYEKDLEQFLDIKLSLKNELNEFITKLSKYWISVIWSAHKTAYTYLDQPVVLPNIYQRIILSTDMITLSGIFSKAKSFSTSELFIVNDAYLYLSESCKKLSFADSLLNLFVPNSFKEE